jgi:hypothetical protein
MTINEKFEPRLFQGIGDEKSNQSVRMTRDPF